MDEEGKGTGLGALTEAVQRDKRERDPDHPGLLETGTSQIRHRPQPRCSRLSRLEQPHTKVPSPHPTLVMLVLCI